MTMRATRFWLLCSASSSELERLFRSARPGDDGRFERVRPREESLIVRTFVCDPAANPTELPGKLNCHAISSKRDAGVSALAGALANIFPCVAIKVHLKCLPPFGLSLSASCLHPQYGHPRASLARMGDPDDANSIAG